MGKFTLQFSAAFVLCIGSLLTFSLEGIAQADEPNPPPLSLSEAFGKPVPTNPSVSTETTGEVEPVVVGRKKWSDRAAENTSRTTAPNPAKSVKIEELDPLETKQPKSEKIKMPQASTLPSTSIEISREPWFSNQEIWALSVNFPFNWKMPVASVWPSSTWPTCASLIRLYSRIRESASSVNSNLLKKARTNL